MGHAARRSVSHGWVTLALDASGVADNPGQGRQIRRLSLRC